MKITSHKTFGQRKELISTLPMLLHAFMLFIIRSQSTTRIRQTIDMLILVQLSDLHTGGAYFKQEIFDTIINEVNNNLKPDVTLITGDLTNEGLISQFEQANIEIEAQRRLSQCNTSTFYQEEDK